MVLSEKEVRILKFLAGKRLASSLELRKFLAENFANSSEGEKALKRLKDLEFVAELNILFDKSYVITNKGLNFLEKG